LPPRLGNKQAPDATLTIFQTVSRSMEFSEVSARRARMPSTEEANELELDMEERLRLCMAFAYVRE
jgi:hypothetical protein